jgi:hypothetical protein
MTITKNKISTSPVNINSSPMLLMGGVETLSNIQLTESKQAKVEEKNSAYLDLELEKKKTHKGHFYWRIMKIPIIYMRIFGLNYRKSDPLLFKVYNMAVLAALWTNFLKFITVLVESNESFSASLVLKIVTQIWLFSCATNTAIIFINNQRAGREAKLIDEYNQLWEQYSNSNVSEKKLKLKILIIMTSALVVGLFNSVTGFISLFGPNALFVAYGQLLAPFHNSDWAKASIPYKLLIAIILSYTSLSWTMCIGYFIAHCQILNALLRNFNIEFKEFVSSNIIVSKNSVCLNQIVELNRKDNIYENKRLKRYSTEDRFEEFRFRHLKLCFCVRTLNNCYKELISFILIFYVPIEFLLLFIISDWRGNCVVGLMEILYPFWFIVSLSIVVILIMNASVIHTQV